MDEHLRQLERQAQVGDVDAQGELIRLGLRAGTTLAHKVRVAALLGHGGARRVLPMCEGECDAAPFPHDWNLHDHHQGPTAWGQSLTRLARAPTGSAWGPEVMRFRRSVPKGVVDMALLVRCMLSVAQQVWPAWLAHQGLGIREGRVYELDPGEWSSRAALNPSAPDPLDPLRLIQAMEAWVEDRSSENWQTWWFAAHEIHAEGFGDLAQIRLVSLAPTHYVPRFLNWAVGRAGLGTVGFEHIRTQMRQDVVEWLLG